MFRLLRSLLIALPLFLRAAEDRLADPERTWQGIPGIERTAGGRLFASWFTGGPKEPSPENEVLLCYSDDRAQTFTTPVVMAGPRDGGRCFDPTLWIDPKGRLWYIFNRGDKAAGKHDVWARICDAPDATKPVFGAEFRVGYDEPYAFRMNKPTVLSTGEWVMPVTHSPEVIHDWFANDKQRQGVGISKDKGKTWTLHGLLKSPAWALECMVTELKDGRLWLLNRTGGGVLWQSFSTDRGQTWTESEATTIANPGSRFFIRRLASGNLLLVNHYKFTGRSHLTAKISTDDGATWTEGLLLDERANVSYPDAVQDKDGLIWVIYDRDRQGDGEILLARFREEDAAAGKNVSGAVALKHTVSKLVKPSLLPAGWDPALAGDAVMERLVNTSAPQVKGAHDAELVCVGDRAYVVTEANDVQAGESAAWSFIYATMSIVNLRTLAVEKVIDFAKTEQQFANEKLPAGACFVPRILQKDAKTLRCYFTSEGPGQRQSQMWYRDFDLGTQEFAPTIHKAKLQTAAGTFDFQPQYFHADAAAQGFTRKAVDCSFFIFDSFKRIDGKLYVALNNFTGKQNALALVHDDLETFEVLGHYNEPQSQDLSESAVNRLPNGTWMAICRNDKGNYHFATSADGRKWKPGETIPSVPNGANSKPTFDRFGDIYYLGWQENTRVHGVSRSVFNVDISRDGRRWERKYRFETPKSFQYPTFHEHEGVIWLVVTQGDTDPSRKERIMFGKLEEVGKFESLAGRKRTAFAPPSPEPAVLKRGVKLFTDREYVVEELPAGMEGLSFLRTSIEKCAVEVQKPGTLFAVTPAIRPSAASQDVALRRQGFRRVDGPEVQFFPGLINRVVAYQREVKAGDRFRFSKMVVLATDAGAEIAEYRPAPPGPWTANDGETLYNGIRLPKVWPPAHYDEDSAEPMDVPYLQHPPAVIPIDVGRQLFVDDFLIAQTDLMRTFHQAQKFAGNPVFKAETPTELNALGGGGEGAQEAVTYLGHGGVFYEPSERLFKMFYTAGWRGPLALATSPDLKTWTRPQLGFGEANILRTRGNEAGGDNAVWLDLGSKDAHLKFLADRGGAGHMLQTSADGRVWTPPVFTGPAGDYCSFFFNPFRQKWVYSIKQGSKQGRNRWYHESADFLAGADWSRSVFWANADRLDEPDPTIGKSAQLYSLSAVAYESVLLGEFQIHLGPDNKVCDAGKFPKITDLKLGFSRDGYHWARPDRRAFIAATRKEGDWDRGYVHATTGVCVVLDDQLVFPYCAYSGVAPSGARGMYTGGSIGLATLRRDGFASLDAGPQPGTLTTRPVTFQGRDLYVNLAAPTGELRAEILGPGGEVLASSKPITGDSTKHRLQWDSIPDLSTIAGKPVQLRFKLRQGSLYSFWTSSTPTGASGGYVASGGSGFAGVRDE